MKPKILIVDDDLDFIEISRLNLEGKGYQVRSATDGKEGWKMVEKEKPDLIIMDLMMERLDAGVALSQRIKSHPQYGSIPILMLTSISRDTGMDFTPRTADDLKSHPQYASIPILMLTSISRDTGMDFAPRTPEDLQKLKVDDFHTKPIKAKTLLQKVEKLLASKGGAENP
jgi:CheY-like chemotaxis protein